MKPFGIYETEEFKDVSELESAVRADNDSEDDYETDSNDEDSDDEDDEESDDLETPELEN